MRSEIKTVLILLLSVFSCSKSFAIQEQVELEKTPLALPVNKLISPDFKLKDSFRFEDKFINQVDLKLYVDLENTMEVSPDEELTSRFTMNAIEPGAVLHFKDNKTRVGIVYNFTRDLDYNPFFEKFSSLYVERDILPHQKISVGMNARAPIGYEGKSSTIKIPLGFRSQISRNFSNTYAFGIRNIADYKYFGYDIGYYDASRYMDKLFSGSEFIGNFKIKPLANTNGKYGNLEVGTSIDTGHRDGSFTVVGANALYKYKKAFVDFEYAKANGSHARSYSRDEAEGFYTTLGYNLTDKVQLVGRYDYYNNRTQNSATKEYTLGVSFIPRSGLKFLANYSLIDADSSHHVAEHRIYLGTRFYLTDFCNNI